MFNRNTIDVCINHISIPYLWLQVDSKPDVTNPESSSIMSEKLHDGGLHFTTAQCKEHRSGSSFFLGTGKCVLQGTTRHMWCVARIGGALGAMRSFKLQGSCIRFARFVMRVHVLYIDFFANENFEKFHMDTGNPDRTAR